MQSHVVSEVDSKAEKNIDREKVCPFLLRIFPTTIRHNSIQDFKNGNVPTHNELQIYTWMDCTLRELMLLIKDVNTESKPKGTSFDFALVSPDRFSPRMNIRTIGVTINGTRGIDDAKTLADCKFEVGDYIDVAITPPRGPREYKRPIDGPPGRRFDRFGSGERFERDRRRF
ncbi:hypothetical protein FO519_008013 [Halicephalobus sp. NKZ332]|nr:hypothetical protein FO519_008013 [Halicephalobus sp. NKZ332]